MVVNKRNNILVLFVPKLNFSTLYDICGTLYDNLQVAKLSSLHFQLHIDICRGVRFDKKRGKKRKSERSSVI